MEDNMGSLFLSIPMWTPGVGEIVVIAVVVLVLFGGAKIPQLGKGLGEGIRNFKQGLKGEEAPPTEAIKKSDSSDAKR
jgi:TatA/E family protein of Tat protein translocase